MTDSIDAEHRVVCTSSCRKMGVGDLIGACCSQESAFSVLHPSALPIVATIIDAAGPSRWRSGLQGRSLSEKGVLGTSPRG